MSVEGRGPRRGPETHLVWELFSQVNTAQKASERSLNIDLAVSKFTEHAGGELNCIFEKTGAAKFFFHAAKENFIRPEQEIADIALTQLRTQECLLNSQMTIS
jgi:hypothetical protein